MKWWVWLAALVALLVALFIFSDGLFTPIEIPVGSGDGAYPEGPRREDPVKEGRMPTGPPSNPGPPGGTPGDRPPRTDVDK
jgi:hypothetical protein